MSKFNELADAMMKIDDEQLTSVAGGTIGHAVEERCIDNLKKLYPNVTDEGLKLIEKEMKRYLDNIDASRPCVISNCNICGKQMRYGGTCSECISKRTLKNIEEIVSKYTQN